MDNAFQSVPDDPPATVSAAAYAEVSQMVDDILARGVTVHVFEDPGYDRPDSVFPNNWFTTHGTGDLVLYPMHNPSRRGERRPDVVEALQSSYDVRTVHDYSELEAAGTYLEGTGAMVLDHVHRLAYVCRSHRANEEALLRFCSELAFTPVVFDATDNDGTPIYHTNVLMAVGTEHALIGLEAIRDRRERDKVTDLLTSTGHEVVDLSLGQVASFAGNALELQGTSVEADGRFLVMSNRGIASLTDEQRAQVERHVPFLGVDIPTIELAGGSARCMLAGIHLEPKGLTTAL